MYNLYIIFSKSLDSICVMGSEVFMLLSCVDYIQRHFALNNFEVANYFVPIRKKDIPFNLFNPAHDYKSKSYVLFDSGKKDIYICFKSTRGFCYFRSCDSRVYSSWISFNEV